MLDFNLLCGCNVYQLASRQRLMLSRFPCGRWLGKGVDDGAIERLLVAELVPSTIDANGQ